MSNVPSHLKYTNSHEWIRVEADGTAFIGITEHAQDLLGDMVFVELPELEEELDAGDEVATVESVKAASDVYAPITGTVVAVNEELENAPELVNSDCYGDGWLFQVKVEDTAELESLLDAEGYTESLEEE